MPTHLELAMLSKQIYFKDGGHVTGWTCREYYQDDSGLAVAAYESITTNEMVIAFRGTDTGNFNNFLNNLATNFHLVMGRDLNTAISAEDFVKRIRENRSPLQRLKTYLCNGTKNQLYLTGHSLGGTLAQRVGFSMIKLGKPYRVVTFENPGIAHFISCEDLTHYAMQLQQQFMTYLVDPNLINTLHPHVGIVRRLHLKPYSSTFFSKALYYKSHIADCLFNEMLRDILLLVIFNMLFIHFFGKNYYTNVVATTTRQLSTRLTDSADSKESDHTNPLDILLFFIKCLVVIGKSITQGITITSRQHTIEAIISELTKGGGGPTQWSAMRQWPTHKQYLLSQGRQVIEWFDPRKTGLLHIHKADELHEASVLGIDGYVENCRYVKR